MSIRRPAFNLDTAIFIACWLGALALFFRFQILNGFSVLIGDRYDGIIETTILEHWYNFWRGLESFNQTSFFFPVKDTLGYNDGYFLYGVLYSLMRAVGLNPFFASETVDVLILAVGFPAMYLCARSALAMGPRFSVVAATLFILSPNIYVQARHVQLLSVSFAPLLFVLLLWFFEALSRGQRRTALVLGLSAAGLHALWLLSTFYMAWFFVFFFLFVVLAALIKDTTLISRAWQVDSANRWVLAVVLTFYALINIPFVIVYEPKLVESGQHSLREALTYVPSFWDIFNVGPGLYFFSKYYDTLRQLLGPDALVYGEKASGFSPLIILLFVACCIFLFRKGPRIGLSFTLALATLVSWVCIMKYDGHSLWPFIYAYVPGAKAVRTVARYQIFLSFPVTLLAVYFLEHAFSKWALWIQALPIGLLIAGQITLASNVDLVVKVEMAQLEKVPPAPPACKAFFVTRSRDGDKNLGPFDGIYSHNVDAMMFAEYTHVPTLNGFDTFVPPGWQLIQPLNQSAYMSYVESFATFHNLTKLCSLDLAAMRWDTTPLEARPKSPTIPVEDLTDATCVGFFDIVRMPAQLKLDAVELQGWIDLSTTEVTPPDDIQFQLVVAEKHKGFYPAMRIPRSDVGAVFNNSHIVNSGFDILVPVQRGYGNAFLRPVLRYAGKTYACTNLSVKIVSPD